MHSIQKRFGVIAGFVVLLVLLVINTAVLRRQLATQVSNQEWFSRSRRVLQELRTIDILLKDAEAGQRGYLYTGKLDYLAPYSLAIGQLDAHVRALHAQISDEAPQRTEAATLDTLVNQKLAELRQTITLFQAGDQAGARALVMSDLGYNLMQNIRSLIDHMEQEETSVGEARRAVYQRSIRLTAFLIYASSVVAALGLLVLASSILREMARREKDAATLRQSEERFRVTLSSIGDGVIATDAEGRVTFLNPVAQRLTGISLAEAQGKQISEVFPIFSEISHEPLENPVDKVLSLGHVVKLSNHAVLRQRDGQLLPIEDSAAPILDDAGKLAGVVLVFHDASRERSMQDVLRRTEKLAAAARLAATVSHEINNPLEAVGNLVFLARTHGDAPATVVQQLQLAEQELARVSHITRQTLGFYRESTSPALVQVRELIESVLTLYSNKLQTKRVQVELALEELPSIIGLAGEIQQLISNLISNAIDAVPVDGKLKLRTTLVTLDDGQWVEFAVEDDGPGIPPENMKRIFEPFFTTKKDVGTGLGLWVCKEIAERHGGSVTVQPNRNGTTGAVFTVVLPYQETSIGKV